MAMGLSGVATEDLIFVIPFWGIRYGVKPRAVEADRYHVQARGQANRALRLNAADESALVSAPVEDLDPRVQVVAFSLDGDRYAVPLTAAERVLPMVAISPLPGAPEVVLGAVNLHGDVVAVLDIRRRLGLGAGEMGPSARLLVGRTERRVIALPADAVEGVLEIATAAIVPPESMLPGLEHVSGVVPLADGLLLIHDLDSFFSIDEERQLAEAVSEEQR
jgi:purine-binding chemotaxis protein CheW